MNKEHLVLVLVIAVALTACRRKRSSQPVEEGLSAPETVQAPAVAAAPAEVAAVRAVQAGTASPQQQRIVSEKILNFEMQYGRPAGGLDELLKPNATGRVSPSRPLKK